MAQLPVPILWGVGTSRTIRAHWVLCELGVEYETREIIPRTDSMNDPAFLSVSTRGKVPILQHGALTLGESGAIVLYLADRYSDRLTLTPEPSTTERARFDEMYSFIMTELDAPLYVIRRHEGLPDIYGASQTAVDAARDYFLRQANVIETWLASGPYLLGEKFSAVDILAASCAMWAQFIGIDLPARLAEYLAGISARDGAKQAFQNNFTPKAMAELSKNRG